MASLAGRPDRNPIRTRRDPTSERMVIKGGPNACNQSRPRFMLQSRYVMGIIGTSTKESSPAFSPERLVPDVTWKDVGDDGPHRICGPFEVAKSLDPAGSPTAPLVR